MYIDTSTVRIGQKSYTRYLLRESFRDHGKVKHRTIANLSQCSEQEISAMRLAFKHKKQLDTLTAHLDAANASVGQQSVSAPSVPVNTDQLSVQLRQGQSIGAVWLLAKLADELGITHALGQDHVDRLALWQIIARVIDQGSRLSATRLARLHSCAFLILPPFDEDDLYENLDWLSLQQETIERTLFAHTHSQSDAVTTTNDGLFLYDVTSSYLEGSCNALAAFGYNRDRKEGKSQIVIGLLCDGSGIPVSIEVFTGNTQDPKTVKSQIDKLARRFGATDVTLVGDRGMIKSPEMALLDEKNWSYITAITKPQIEGLLKSDVLQMSLFDDGLVEVADTVEQVRYVLRRNPVRQNELAASHKSKCDRLQTALNKANTYLKEHVRAKATVTLQQVTKKLQSLGLSDWVSIQLEGRVFSMHEDAQLKAEHTKLDGCYVIKTNLPVRRADKEIVHSCYKDLAQVEWAFRTSKTVLEMRPVYVRRESRTRGHALVVMLAYRLIQELAKRWSTLDITVQEGISQLTTLCVHQLSVNDQKVTNCVPIPNEIVAKLFKHANIGLPRITEQEEAKISTKTKLTPRKN